MNIKNKYLFLLLYLIVKSACLFSSSPVLNFREEEFLRDRNHFTVLVSPNNYPYEFINSDGEFDGINIRFIQEILKFTKSEVHFTSNNYDSRIDFASSLMSSRTNFSLETSRVFSSQVYFLYEKNIDFEKIDRYIILNQEYLVELLKTQHPYKNFLLIDDIIRFYNLYEADKNNIYVFDEFSSSKVLKIFDYNDNSSFVVERQDQLNIDFYLMVPRYHTTLWQILSKSISSLTRRNIFYGILQKYERDSQRLLFYQLNEKKSTLVLSGLILIALLFLFGIYKFKLWNFKLDKTLNSFRHENNMLKIEKDSLILQLENMKSRDVNFLSNMNNLALLIDLKGNILYINQYSRYLLGYSPDILIGQNIDKIMTYENKQKLLNLSYIENQFLNLISLKSKDNAVANEIEIQSKDGLIKHYIFSANFTKSEKGTMQIHCILQDISDRISAKTRLEAMTDHLQEIVSQRLKQLEETKERVNFVIDKAFNGIFMMQDNSFTLVNDALCSITGYTKNHFQKVLKFSDIIETSEYNHLNDIINYNIAKNITYFITQTKIKKYLGDIIDVEIHFTTVIEDNEFIILGVIHEMDIKKDYEEKKKESEKLNILLSFATTMNDKINSPLTSIQGYTELLESLNDNPLAKHKSVYKQIYDSIAVINSHMDKLTKLTAVKLTKYNFEKIDMIDLDMNDIINELSEENIHEERT